MKLIEVVAAVIIQDKKVFVAQRNGKGEVGFKWEFPGGKIEPGESNESALIRELKEELCIDAAIGNFLLTVHHQYQTFNLKMHCYLTTIISGTIQLSEHIDSRWLQINEINSVDYADADKPIVEYIQRILK